MLTASPSSPSWPEKEHLAGPAMHERPFMVFLWPQPLSRFLGRAWKQWLIGSRSFSNSSASFGHPNRRLLRVAELCFTLLPGFKSWRILSAGQWLFQRFRKPPEGELPFLLWRHSVFLKISVRLPISSGRSLIQTSSAMKDISKPSTDRKHFMKN